MKNLSDQDQIQRSHIPSLRHSSSFVIVSLVKPRVRSTEAAEA